MGHKVHPYGFRLGVSRTWTAKWYADKEYTASLKEDIAIRTLIDKRLSNASVSGVEVERGINHVTVTIHTAKPGIVIGKSGAKVEELRKVLEAHTTKKVRLNIQEIRQPELDAELVARSVAEQIERRVAFRRAIKQSAQRTMQRGAKGVRIVIAGRLGGSEMARREAYREGRVPLHTLRADIDYGFREAKTTFGRIGVKVWIYKGDILPYKISTEDKISREAAMAVGETSGQGRPRRIISAGGGRRRPEHGEPGTAPAAEEATEGTEAPEAAKPILPEVDPDIERLLAEEEEIERRTREHHEAPHFRKETD